MQRGWVRLSCFMQLVDMVRAPLFIYLSYLCVYMKSANIQYEMYSLGTSLTFYNVLLYDEAV